MTTAPSAPQNSSTLPLVRLVAERRDGHQTQCVLEGSVIVGSSPTCGLQLVGPAVGPIHCLFREVEGEVWVRDWYSSPGTSIDAQRIQGETRVSENAVVEVGDYRIQVHVSKTLPNQQAPVQSTRVSRPEASRSEPEPILAPQHVESQVESQVEPPIPSSAELESVFEYEEADLPFMPDGAIDEVQPMEGPLDDETIGLLSMEIEQLQQEIAIRDARISELEMAGSAASGESGAETDDDSVTAQLVQRLEQVLDELEEGDQRVAAMEQMLQIAEEANQAEQEERRQLEAWVKDIEVRISQRESEWKAESKQWQQRLAAAIEERADVQRRLQASASPAEARSQQEQLVEPLRHKNTELKRELEEERQRSRRLEDQLQDLQRAPATVERQVQIDEQLRAERVQIAQERAALSRLRAELTEKMNMSQRNATQPISEVDGRMRAFREHLREIHDQEKTSKQKPSDEPSLGARIARLWKRLE